MRSDLFADFRSHERSLVAHPALADAGQHPARSDDVLRHDADRPHPQPVLARHRDGRSHAAEHGSTLADHILRRPCRYFRYRLLHSDIPIRRDPTCNHLLHGTGKCVCKSLRLNLSVTQINLCHLQPPNYHIH